MDKKLKHALIVVGFGIILFNALTHLGTVLEFVKKLGNLALPLIIGFVLAFVLNVPMRGIENMLKNLFKGKKKAPGKKLLRLVSLFLTLIILALVIVLLSTLIIPELIESAMSLYNLVMEKWPEWLAYIQSFEFEWVNNWLASVDISAILSNFGSGAGDILSSAMGIVTSTVSGVINVGIGLVIMIYALISKDVLARQGKKFLHSFAGEKLERNIIHVLSLINKTYSKFLSGQCLEACILGSLMFIAFSIAGVPYASITAVLTAVCAFIPYVGALLACVVGAFLVLLAAPQKLILCVVLYAVVQFIENQFIYPHVVGTSVGLEPIWTLMAVILGGKLMGILGMIFFIPLVAVLMTLIKEQANVRLKNKNEGLAEIQEPSEEKV
ncbi:MAG: AI-2E family transporter [Oscillospiraceae bacterium]|nr:AI-2E family transporter [Oscillospiraceae bacterium]